MPFGKDDEIVESTFGEGDPIVDIVDGLSPENWQDQLRPEDRRTLETLHLEEDQKNEIYDALYFANAMGITEPDDIAMVRYLVPDIIEITDFQPHKDDKPFDARKHLSEAVKHGYRRAGVMMTKQLAGIGKVESELGGRFREWAWGKTPLGRKPRYLAEIDKRLKEWSDMMLAGVEEYYKIYPEEAIQIMPELGYLATLKEYVTKPENLVQGIIESSPLMLEGILGAVTGGTSLAIVTMGLPISGEVYADARAEKTEPIPAFAQALLTGLGEATIETWTLSRKLGLLKNFRKMIAGGLPRVLWEGTKAFFRGTAEEGSQEFDRNFWQWVFTDRSQDWLANVTESMAAGGPIEMVMAGGFSAAGAVATPITKSQQIDRLGKIRAAVNENTELSEEHKAEINKDLDQVQADVQADVYALQPQPEAAAAAERAKVPPEGIKAPPKPAEAKITPEEARRRDLLGREELRGGAAGAQAAFLEKEKYRLAEPDIEGQMVMPHEVTEEAVPVKEAEPGLEIDYLEKTGRTISQTTKLIKAIEKKIVASDIYQAQLEAQEIRAREIDVGVYYVSKTFKGEVKDAIANHPSLKFHITHDRTKGTPWDTAVQEGLLLRTGDTAGEMDISVFLERVAEALETRKKVGKLNVAAFEAAQEMGDPDTQILADIRYGLEQGKTSAEINAKTKEWAEFYGRPETELEGYLIKELTDEQRKKAIETARTKDEKMDKLEATRRAEAAEKRKVKQEEIKETLAVQKRLREEAAAKKTKTSKLRQKIHAVAAVRGLTKKALSDLKLKHTGYRTISGKVAAKKITTDQLEALLAAVRKARPKTVDGKKVLTRKQENKIASLKENLINLKHLTEADYTDILKIETRGKEAKYIDSKHFITQKEAQAVIKRIHNQAEITRVTETEKAPVRKNPEIAQHVAAIDKTINDKRAKMRRDPWQSESMRYYNEQMELKTGAPFYALYVDMTDTRLETTKTRTARLLQLKNEAPGFDLIAKDKEALQRISQWISSKSRLKTPVPKNITAEEITMAKAIQKIFKEYEAKARWTRFYWWYVSGRQEGAYPIGDYDQYKKEIGKAVDIYESKGKDDVIEYLETQKWGIIKSGYEPLEQIVQKIRLYKLKPTTVGKSHIEIRTAVEYHGQDRDILRRLGAYMRQIDMLNDLSPKINAYVQLFEDNQTKFNNPARVKESVEVWLQTLKRYNIEGGFWARITARLYAQAMRTVIMPSPVLSFRNLFQNFAFYHDKTNLIDPRNKTLSSKRVEFLETYVQQQRAMVEEYFMMGEKPLPGLKTISKLVEYVKIYPVSDLTNRHLGFWAKVNQVDRALEADTTAEMMTEAKFSDITDFEQRMALSILARDGKDAMANFVSRTVIADIHFLYERAQRAPVEMGGGLARVYGNLMLFPRAYGEKLAHQADKMINGETFEEQWRAAKVLMAVIGGGLIAGSIFMKITGRKRNPYNPLRILSWRPGGLAHGAIEAVSEIYSNMIMATMGDKRALAAFLNALPAAANMFIPFYDISLRGIEAVTDQKNIDYKLVREMRAAIDKEYKVRGGAYKLKRNALEKWQYFIGGAGVDTKEKKTKKGPVITAD